MGGRGGRPRAKRCALVSVLGSAETAAAPARTAMTVVNFMIPKTRKASGEGNTRRRYEEKDFAVIDFYIYSTDNQVPIIKLGFRRST